VESSSVDSKSRELGVPIQANTNGSTSFLEITDRKSDCLNQYHVLKNKNKSQLC
jgi:hypothetical protein